MLNENFLKGDLSYKVNISDMDTFLKDCEYEDLKWSHGLNPTEFNPFKFYEGDSIKYIEPVQNINERNYIYVTCFEGIIRFTFEKNWKVIPYQIYKLKERQNNE